MYNICVCGGGVCACGECVCLSVCLCLLPKPIPAIPAGPENPCKTAKISFISVCAILAFVQPRSTRAIHALDTFIYTRKCWEKEVKIC